MTKVIKRGFASLSPERMREIAQMGGRAVPKEKRSYALNRELARESGRKGGKNVQAEKRMFSRNRELAATAGSKGGLAIPPHKRTFSTNAGLAKRAGRLGGMASHDSEGYEEGDRCNRSLPEGETAKCSGTMVIKTPGPCECHAARNPPCGNCESSFLACNSCGHQLENRDA